MDQEQGNSGDIRAGAAGRTPTNSVAPAASSQSLARRVVNRLSVGPARNTQDGQEPPSGKKVQEGEGEKYLRSSGRLKRESKLIQNANIATRRLTAGHGLSAAERPSLISVSTNLTTNKDFPTTRKGRGDFQTVIQHYTQLSLSTENIRKLFSEAVRKRDMTLVNINGRVFSLPTNTCLRIPTLRDQMAERGMSTPGELTKDKKPKEIFFERNAIVFIAVIDYVTNNELHVPREICPKLFAKEITFWGYDIEEVEPCCFPALMHFLWEQDKLARFQAYLYNKVDTSPSTLRRNFFNDGDEAHTWRHLQGLAYFKAIVWGILDEPFSSRLAQVYFTIMCLFISLSFFCMSAETLTYFQKNCTVPDLNQTMPGVDISLFYLDQVCSSYFYIDYLLRILFYPLLRHFFYDVINVTDGLAFASTITSALLRTRGTPNCWVETLNSDYSYFLDLPKLLRTFRLIRPMSKLTGFRLMWFTLKCSFHELMLVLMLLTFLVVMFSSFLYYLGNKDIKDIPDAMWYTVITMTTVGYGDITPTGWRSMLIGSVVAVFGVIMMSMTTPIMVSNFHSLYINAVVGEPSTIKKVRLGVDKGGPGSTTSLTGTRKTPSEFVSQVGRSQRSNVDTTEPGNYDMLALSRFLTPKIWVNSSKKSLSHKVADSEHDSSTLMNTPCSTQSATSSRKKVSTSARKKVSTSYRKKVSTSSRMKVSTDISEWA